MTDILLTGIDGKNPIGYLAALGALRVAQEAKLSPTLRWELQLRDEWRPILTLAGDRNALMDVLAKDVQSWSSGAEELKLCYTKETKSGTSQAYELKPPPEVFQEFARASAVRALAGSRRWADHAAAYAAAHGELGLDRGGKSTKPTAFHFCAGNQLFLAATRKICTGLQPEDLEEALFGPWRYESELPLLGWDVVAGERDYALRAENPSKSKEKKRGVPGADWLAFRGLAFFPVVLRKGHAVTTGFEGGGKRYTFHWALWTPAVNVEVVKSLVASRWGTTSQEERSARGIALALSSRVKRSDRGYGSFGAASVE